MEKERKITAPEGCEIEKVELIDGVAVVTFKEKERKLPKSWEEFCEMFPKIKAVEYYVGANSGIIEGSIGRYRKEYDKNLLPDRATAEAVLALCQLIQLRNAYNGDWVPSYEEDEDYYFIDFMHNIPFAGFAYMSASILFFKNREIRDEFLRNFRPLIEKTKPLYGIKEGEYINVEERGGKE